MSGVIESELFSKSMQVNMPDGNTYSVPVEFIATHRAKYYADIDFGGDVNKSLIEDTIPVFTRHPDEIIDWAISNMNWVDVKDVSTSRPTNIDYDFEDTWVCGDHYITDQTI